MPEPAAKMPTASPETRPRASGYHLNPTESGGRYPKPRPKPTSTPAVRYIIGSECAKLASMKPPLKHSPPMTAMVRAPTRAIMVPATLYMTARNTILMVDTNAVSVRVQPKSASSGGMKTLHA
jgi:hypothetical protein